MALRPFHVLNSEVTTRMLAINMSIPNLTVARLEQFPSPQMTDNKPSFTRKPHVVIFRQSPFAANAVPKLVVMATSLRPSISAMSSLDSLSGWIKMPLGMEVGLSQGDFVLDGNPAPTKFSAHVYYSYCNFVRTLHKAQSLLVYSSSSFIFYAFYFFRKVYYYSCSLFQLNTLCTIAPHSADSGSRSCEFCNAAKRR